jgi:hypothetical protein
MLSVFICAELRSAELCAASFLRAASTRKMTIYLLGSQVLATIHASSSAKDKFYFFHARPCWPRAVIIDNETAFR